MQQCKQEAEKVLVTQWSIKQNTRLGLGRCSAHSHIPGEEAEKKGYWLFMDLWARGGDPSTSRKILSQNRGKYLSQGCPFHIPSFAIRR